MRLAAIAAMAIADYVTAFAPVHIARTEQWQSTSIQQLFASSFDNNNESELVDLAAASPYNKRASSKKKPGRQDPVMSIAIPFLKCPEVLVDSDLAGNVGFDPAGFAKNEDDLIFFREAEIKHARLAMLVRFICSEMDVAVLSTIAKNMFLTKICFAINGTSI
jgi:Chlorophyll A-B binding protein